VTEEQKALLEMVTDELGGKLSYWICVDKNTEHKKIVIEYDLKRKG
jgi:hypothetical protein